MNKKVVIPLVVIIFTAILVIALIIVFIPITPTPGARKSIIVCSANDFYGSNPEDEFNGSPDAHFSTNTGNWTHTDTLSNSFLEWAPFGNKTSGSLFVKPLGSGPINASLTYNWTDHYSLQEYVLYNISISVQINETGNLSGNGARIGIQWLDSSDNVVRTDWSVYLNNTRNKWRNINMFGVCNNETGNEIFKMKLILAFEGDFIGAGPTDSVHYDDVLLDRLIQVNLTDPTDPDPPPPGLNSDGFPAQALQAYWVLKNHGYSNDDIFLMLYYKNDADGIIDIDFFDGIPDDLNRPGIEIDVENDDVNASRFKQELNVSISGSFASNIKSKDQLIIYMVDHGSNAMLGDGNATFHFEADNSWIDEFEFYDLVKEIDCERMLICIDCCFSGNFLNENQNIGQSWYDLPNCIFISASSNLLAWYWIGNKNPDGFAGSWFFHPFWQRLDQNYSIGATYNFALGFMPSTNQPRPVAIIQNPLMYDNLKINDTWGFDGNPQL